MAHLLGYRLPVLTSVRAPYNDAWARFHDGLGGELSCDTEHVLNWVARFDYRSANLAAIHVGGH